MSSPQAVAEYENDPTIEDDTIVYRRVHPVHKFWDKSRDCWRVSTALFKDLDLSVHLGDRLVGPAEDLIASFPDHWLVHLQAGDARACPEQKVCAAPTDDDASHGLVYGRKSDGTKRSLARAAEWTVGPPESPCARPYP